MAQPQKETILGNYTAFSHFPLDCESMEYIQENIKHLAIVAQIAGCDKLIIKGCTGNSQSRTEGYVYVRTGDDLVGEILYSPAGSGVRCGISTENINATANNETFTSAYTIRKLVSGTTGEWSWSEFRSLSEITNAALKTLVDGKAAANHMHAISNITGLQAIIDSIPANINLSSYASNDGIISAQRWGNVVTLHINGLKVTALSNNVSRGYETVTLPKKFQPTFGDYVYGVGYRGYVSTGFESSGISLCMRTANLETPTNNVLIEWRRASGFNNLDNIYATLTYITLNSDS